MNKGYNEKEAKQKLSDRQKTFTLNKCVIKYGEIKGLEIWNDRQRKWSEKIEQKYKNGDFVRFNNDMTSIPENELFESIAKKLNIEKSSYYGKNQF